VVANFDGGRCRNGKVALGAVAPTPMRATAAERLLEGRELDQALIEIAARAAADESRPITDIRGSADYRREMVKVFVRAAIKSVLPKENDRGNEIATAIQS
jgi:carbon-monoxide dehydrogenase medium subunit